MSGTIGNLTSPANVLWMDPSNQTPKFMAIYIHGVIWLTYGLVSLMGIFQDSRRSLPGANREWLKNTILYHFISLTEATLIFVYVFMTSYFVSVGMQITMLALLFVGPQLASLILFTPYKDCLEYAQRLFHELAMNKTGETFSGNNIFGKIQSILKSILALLVTGVVLICYGVLGTLAAVILGYFYLSTLQRKLPYIVKGTPEEENDRHLLNSMIVHLLCFSIPEMVMVALNLRLDVVKEVIIAGPFRGTRIRPNHEYSWAAIMFFVFFGFECALAMLFGMKKYCRSANPNESNRVQTTSGTTNIRGTSLPVRVSATPEADFLSISDVQSSKKHVKTLDDDLEEPSWMNLNHPAKKQEPIQPPLLSQASSANAEGAGGSLAVECPICFTTGKKKKVLIPCGHMLCNGCFVGMQANASGRCPFCQQAYTLASDLYF